MCQEREREKCFTSFVGFVCRSIKFETLDKTNDRCKTLRIWFTNRSTLSQDDRDLHICVSDRRCHTMLSGSETRASLTSSSKLCQHGLSHRASFRNARRQRCRNTTVAALGFFRKKIATSGAVDDILAAVESTERGCSTSQSQKTRIDAAIGVLAGSGVNNNQGLSATWKLLWTTEKVRAVNRLRSALRKSHTVDN